MDLFEALQKQIEFCKKYDRYRCGVYVQNKERRKIVVEMLEKMLPIKQVNIFRVNRLEAEIFFKNGSSIRIVEPIDHYRGCKFNGAIVDNDIEREKCNCIVFPSLIRMFRDGSFEEVDNLKNRLHFVDISWDDAYIGK